jgi:hypothetical protein
VDCRLAATLYYFQHVTSDGKFSQKSAAPPGKLKKKDDARSSQEEKSPSE